ncbi:ribosomal protein L7/L12 [Clostridium sulfidigenes]|uniref:ribosomal protein L7/L12 n=1 Tax=Clostridium sulfidigenes TaxID=318464 RepID=UPI003F89C317
MESVYMGLITMLFIILIININTFQRNQDRIDSKLNRIIENFGVSETALEEISDELKAELIKLVEANRKIKAIKKLKDTTGMGLKEAKDYVDSL